MNRALYTIDPELVKIKDLPGLFLWDQMAGTRIHIRLLTLVCILMLANCKHKEKQVATAPIKSNKQPTKVSTRPVENSSGSAEIQQKLGISSKQLKENKLYSFIDEWYGTPYKYAGCQKTGIDCSCFANLLYDKVYNKKIARSSGDMFKACDQISIDEASTGDLVFFKIGGNSISHVGVFIKNKLFVHASNSKGVVINSLDEAYYKKYFFSAGKLKSV